MLTAGFAAPAVAAPSTQEQAAIDQINLRRVQIGLPPLAYHQDLEESARGHANYLAINNTTGHFQTSTAPGFTGVTPFDRIVAAGYGTPWASNEVISFGSATGAEAIEGLIQAIYHRFGIFSSQVDQTGAGVVTNHPTFGTVVVVNSAKLFETPPSLASWVGVYPFDGQTGVTRDFLSDTESPDPVPGANRVGYPISIHVDYDKTLSVTTFTVKPVGGAVLPAQLLTTATDPPDGETPASAAALIPDAPLGYNTEYEVSFAGTSSGEPLSRTWRFTTMPLLPITFSPAQPYLGYNSSIDIEISGGSGTYVGAQTFFALPQPAEVAFIGPRTLRVTSPASGQSPASGTLTIRVTDDEGHTGDVVVTVLDTQAPSVPANLTATVISASQINLAWNASTDDVGVAAYQVYRDGVFRATVTAPAVAFSDTGLTSAVTYTYTVAACDAAGNCSAQSAVASATTSDVTPPSVPAGLSIGSLAANSLTLSWTASTDNVGVTAYRVFRNGTFQATVNAPTTSFNDSGLVSATFYSYTVAACDAAGNCSAQSTAASATTPDNVPPSVPAGLTATAFSSTQIDLGWGASADNVGVTAYRVFRGGVFRATVPAPALGFSDTGLTASTLYSYTVSACDAAGNCSAQSSQVSTSTLSTNQYAVQPELKQGFNMVSNALDITLDVPAIFGNQDAKTPVTDNVLSVWKWNAAAGRWAFYSPTLTVAGNAAYAASQNYDVLATVGPGEGYWANALQAMTLPVQSGTGVNWNGANFPALPSGFNLIAMAEVLTPSQFNVQVSPVPPAPGVVPTDNFTSLWAWNAEAGKWFFYSPLLEATGGLAAVKTYADSHNLLHFEDHNKLLGIGGGFWVNRP
ncbi:MAG: hypothetical protein HYY78_13865 [Betaproteobacteria bacterium]|nr:hypothetical protein [Betaproteobacteria bacterium]